MPTYEYKCKHCGHEFEEYQSMSADALIDCPKCKTPNLVRAIGGGGGMIFKGSGFYQTDYKKSKTESTEQKPSPAPSEKKPASSAKPPTPAKSKE